MPSSKRISRTIIPRSGAASVAARNEPSGQVARHTTRCRDLTCPHTFLPLSGSVVLRWCRTGVSAVVLAGSESHRDGFQHNQTVAAEQGVPDQKDIVGCDAVRARPDHRHRRRPLLPTLRLHATERMRMLEDRRERFGLLGLLCLRVCTLKTSLPSRNSLPIAPSATPAIIIHSHSAEKRYIRGFR